jgi:hypothetical protein
MSATPGLSYTVILGNELSPKAWREMLVIFLVSPDPAYFPLLKKSKTPISVLARQDFPPPGPPIEIILIVCELSIRFLIINYILRQIYHIIEHIPLLPPLGMFAS